MTPDAERFGTERFIQSLQVECLDQLLVFSEKHLDYLVREYGEHCNEELPHQRWGNSGLASVRRQRMLPLS
jgi:hypothetical protein